jgi:hypothetical protein
VFLRLGTKVTKEYNPVKSKSAQPPNLPVLAPGDGFLALAGGIQ